MAKSLKLNLRDLNLDPDMHLYTLAVADPFAARAKDKMSPPAALGVITQDMKDYTVTLVIARARGDTHTHIVATFVVR
jgi:hypothetical protein